jgi:hypothetical protein
MTVHNAAALAATDQPATDRPASGLRITLEMLIYAGLAVLTVVLRMASLGDAPLNDGAAREALAALRAMDGEVPGGALVAHSPLTFLLSVASFTLLTATDFAARLPVALGGVLLTLSPLVWRRYLRPLPALILALLLTISPVVLLASRTGSPVVWSLLLAVLLPWCVLRFVETGTEAWAIAATAAAGALVLLAEPTGVLTLAALAFGVAFAWVTEDEARDDLRARARAVWTGWPWGRALLITAGGVVLVSTAFFTHPAGLTAPGDTLWAGLKGFVNRPAHTPVAFPLWVSLRYEFGIVLFGLIASYQAVREGTFFERALTGWFLAGLVWALVYAGAGAAHALWIVIPLSVLVALQVTRWIVERADAMWNVPGWAVPAHGLLTLALWGAVAVSVVLLGKLLLIEVPGGVDDLGAFARKLVEGIYSRDQGDANNPPAVLYLQDIPVYEYVLGFTQLRLIMTVLVSLLNVVLFFIVGSIWGAQSAGRGFALGTVTFLVLFSFGLGGRAAFENAENPREFWYPNPVTGDADELRDTLRTMSQRANGTPHLIAVTAQVPEDGALAWALRSYPNTTFVHGVGPQVDSDAVLMPLRATEPDLGAPYIGKDLATRAQWDSASLSWRDVLMWYYRGASLRKPEPGEVMMLWIKSDIYGVQAID